MDNYRYLVSEKNMIPIISLNPGRSQDLSQPTVNDKGIPLCPSDTSLPMILMELEKIKIDLLDLNGYVLRHV